MQSNVPRPRSPASSHNSHNSHNSADSLNSMTTADLCAEMVRLQDMRRQQSASDTEVGTPGTQFRTPGRRRPSANPPRLALPQQQVGAASHSTRSTRSPSPRARASSPREHAAATVVPQRTVNAAAVHMADCFLTSRRRTALLAMMANPDLAADTVVVLNMADVWFLVSHAQRQQLRHDLVTSPRRVVHPVALPGVPSVRPPAADPPAYMPARTRPCGPEPPPVLRPATPRGPTPPVPWGGIRYPPMAVPVVEPVVPAPVPGIPTMAPFAAASSQWGAAMVAPNHHYTWGGAWP
jgi:hypothetical protein